MNHQSPKISAERWQQIDKIMLCLFVFAILISFFVGMTSLFGVVYMVVVYGGAVLYFSWRSFGVEAFASMFLFGIAYALLNPYMSGLLLWLACVVAAVAASLAFSRLAKWRTAR